MMNGHDEDNLLQFAADLHVHTALSPCADVLCTPPNIVNAALERGMSIIAVTDHNSAENVEAMARCGRRHGLKVIPGMEVTTQEEVHVICLFSGVAPAMELQQIVYGVLPEGANQPDYFGRQVVMDEEGNPRTECERLLMASAHITLEDLVHIVHKLDGLAIAAHVDRPSFSVLANLGWIPDDAGFDALEVSGALTRDEAVKKFPGIEPWPLVTSSDAHLPDNVGASFTLFLMREMELGEIRMALKGTGGREFLIQ
jgi:3',5'-nucleoside bisphosphate phosphatase